VDQGGNSCGKARHWPPSTVQVQVGIDHFAQISGTGMSSWLGWRDLRFEKSPLFLGHIAWIASSLTLPTSLPFFLFWDFFPFFTPPCTVSLGMLPCRAAHLAIYRPCPPSSGFSSVCTQPLIRRQDVLLRPRSSSDLILASQDVIANKRTGLQLHPVMHNVLNFCQDSLQISITSRKMRARSAKHILLLPVFSVLTHPPLCLGNPQCNDEQSWFS
jgi:hypothetical protein